MSDSSDLVALAGRIRELEAQLIRTALVPSRFAQEGTNCTDCGSNCTNCRGDRLMDVLLPGEDVGLSGRELANRLVASRGK
jgi:hypothetical protein